MFNCGAFVAARKRLKKQQLDWRNLMARLLRRHLYAATVILFGFGNFFLAKAITDSSVVISCVTPPAGLIDWWPGDNSAIDIQGGRNGTLINGAGFAAGKVQAAFNLNTSQQYQYIDVGAVPLPISFTIDAWINPSDLSNSPQIISGDGYLLTVLNNGTLQFTVTSIAGCTVYQTAASIVSTSSWQHVAATYDGSALAGQKINFYVNFHTSYIKYQIYKNFS